MEDIDNDDGELDDDDDEYSYDDNNGYYKNNNNKDKDNDHYTASSSNHRSSSSLISPITNDIDDDDFCNDTFIDSAYYNGYDTILTRGNHLWYYYKDQNRLSRSYDQRRFTQGMYILNVFGQ
mgnify:CR=1 FL=1